MNPIDKLLAKMSRKDKERMLSAMEAVVCGEISGIKLEGKNEYKIRVGSYCIIYRNKKDTVEIISVRRRNENTYK
jgi:mRNA-degrading endonuclease RelE of RelBE toxin-antitoxin system